MFFKTGRFQRADRVLRARDFARAVKSGQHCRSESFVVVISARANAPANASTEVRIGSEAHRKRLGITVSKRVGNSVVRNRVKRRVREWFRHARECLPAGSDTVVIARRGASDLSRSGVEAALDEMICNAKARGVRQSVAESQ